MHFHSLAKHKPAVAEQNINLPGKPAAPPAGIMEFAFVGVMGGIPV